MNKIDYQLYEILIFLQETYGYIDINKFYYFVTDNIDNLSNKKAYLSKYISDKIYCGVLEHSTIYPSYYQLTNFSATDDIFQHEVKQQSNKQISFDNFIDLLKAASNIFSLNSCKVTIPQNEFVTELMKNTIAIVHKISIQLNDGVSIFKFRLGNQIYRQIDDNKNLILGYPCYISNSGDIVPIFYFVLDTKNIINGYAQLICGPVLHDEFVKFLKKNSKEKIVTKSLDGNRTLFTDPAQAFIDIYNDVLDKRLDESFYFDENFLVDLLLNILASNIIDKKFFSYNFAQLSSLDTDYNKMFQNKGYIMNFAFITSSKSNRYSGTTADELNHLCRADYYEYIKDSALSLFFYDNHYLSKQDSTNKVAQNISYVAKVKNNTELDEYQESAVLSILNNDLSIIYGPPGTGKTTVIASAAFNELIRNKSVLVTSLNNAAIRAFNDKAYFESSDSNKEFSFVKELKDSYNAKIAIDKVKLLKEIKDFKRGYLLQHNDDILKDLSKSVDKITHSVSELIMLKDLSQIDLDQKISNLESNYNDIVKDVGEKHFIIKVLKNFLAITELNDLNINFLGSSSNKKSNFKNKLKKLENYIKVGNGTDSFINTLLRSKVFSPIFSLLCLHVLPSTYWHLIFFKYVKVNGLEDFISNYSKIFNLYTKIKTIKTQYNLGRDNKNIVDINEVLDKISDIKNNNLKLSDEVIKYYEKIYTSKNSPKGTTLDTKFKTTSIDNDQKEGKLITNHYRVQSTTLLSVGRSLPLAAGIFDVVIFDEAAQFNFIQALPTIFRAKRISVIGDPKQLAPIKSFNQNIVYQIKKQFNIKLDFDFNMTLFDFVREYCINSNKVTSTIALLNNRRSVKSIVNYISHFFYHDSLLAKRDLSINKLIKLNLTDFNYINKLKEGINYIDVENDKVIKDNGSKYSPQQIKIVIELLQSIYKTNYQGTIGIITPFNSQLNHINMALVKNKLYDKHNIISDTIHSFQGQECDIIILSLPLDTGSNRFAINQNLINVAISRAKDYLFVISNKQNMFNTGIDYIFSIVDQDATQYQARDINASLLQNHKEPDTIQEIRLKEAIEKRIQGRSYLLISQLHLCGYYLDLALIYKDFILDIECDGSQHYTFYKVRFSEEQSFSSYCGKSSQLQGLINEDKERFENLKKRYKKFEDIRFHNSLIDFDVNYCAKLVVDTFEGMINEIQ